MDRAAVEQLLHLMDRAFAGVGESPADVGHSLLANLRSVTEHDWFWCPPGGRRSIATIVDHVGACKYVYDDHAFGDATMTWTDPLVAAPGDRTIAEMLEWVREGHRRLRDHVAALTDHDLSQPSRTNWGEMKDLRWIIAAMIEHDLYHAGEINHIRALRQENDNWAWESS